MWRALVLMLILPLAVAAILGGVSVRSASRSSTEAMRAQHLVTAVELLDAARRSADAEVLPTLLISVLRDSSQASRLGFVAARRGVLRATEPARLAQSRSATDKALDDTKAGNQAIPWLSSRIVTIRVSLAQIRSAADDGSATPEAITSSYAAIVSRLSVAQRAISLQAISSGLSTSSVAALQDLDLVVQLSEAASAQLGELFASRVLPEAAASGARSSWVGNWGSYTELLQQSSRLSRSATRQAWKVFASTADVTTFSTLLDQQALNPQRAVLETGALPGLGARSKRRDDGLAVVLDYAAAAATSAAGTDRAAAVARERVMLGVVLVMVALSLVYAGLVARWLAGSMKALAGSAQQISLGQLLDVHPRGPRELRTAANALSAAVAGLRRMQEQAQAVVAGNLEAALRQQPLPGPLGEVVHASVQQIVTVFRAREELQRELAHQAHHDALTGLDNRAATLRRLEGLLNAEQVDGLHTGVLFIDLDGFKAVNDGHGHAAGDELLREIGRRLLNDVRSDDGVGRFGGDEFVVTAHQVRDVAQLVDLGRRLIRAVSQPVRIGADRGAPEVTVGASIGVAISTTEATSEGLLAEADQAAYRAKRAGRGRVEVFDAQMRATLDQKADMEGALRQALQAGDLRLAYQPVIDLAGGSLIGYEALARWTRAGTGPVPPDVFIPVAESSTLICDLGRWALTAATAQLASWRDRRVAGFGPGSQVEPTIAVNISGRHVADPGILTDVRDALQQSGLPAHLLILEITETVLAADHVSTVRHLTQLRDAGIQVAIDDFGTGYTSIGALSRTPIDILKIDRSFVDSEDDGRLQLTTLMIRAARTFSLQVVAEGIETEAQRTRLFADGCAAGQGYLFSPAVTPEEIEALEYPLSVAPRPSVDSAHCSPPSLPPAQRSTA